MKKLSNTEAELKKSVAYKKCVYVLLFLDDNVDEECEWFFCKFQPGVAYKNVAYKKSVYLIFTGILIAFNHELVLTDCISLYYLMFSAESAPSENFKVSPITLNFNKPLKKAIKLASKGVVLDSDKFCR